MKINIMNNQSFKLLKLADAEKLVVELQVNDPDWTYKVNKNKSVAGLVSIQIYDEDNNLLGNY